MAEKRGPRLDQPREGGAAWRVRLPSTMTKEGFGRASEAFARFMGTPQFLLYMSVFVVVWLLWNTFGPRDGQFDPRELNYTLLTLILSLQASYAAPLILLAQNRQDDRDRVGLEQDRARDERNLADTEYLTREVAALRIAMRDMATRDFLRSELRDLLEELEERGPSAAAGVGPVKPPAKRKKKKRRKRAVLETPSPTSASAAPQSPSPTHPQSPSQAAPPTPSPAPS